MELQRSLGAAQLPSNSLQALAVTIPYLKAKTKCFEGVLCESPRFG